MTEQTIPAGARNRFLDGVERVGNALPDPVFIFLGIIAIVMGVSVVGAMVDWSAVNPVTGETLLAKSLLSEENLNKLFVEMPRTYAGFAPLGLVLTVIARRGRGRSQRTFRLAPACGLGRRSQIGVLTPAVMLMGMLTTHAVDAGYLVYIPLAGVDFRRRRAPSDPGHQRWVSPAPALAWRAICCRASTMC